MKISKHAKIRMRERTDYNHRERKQLFRLALDKGKSIQDIKDDDLKDYINKIQQRECKVKLYLDYIFIYSKNNKQLYTMYKLPESMQEKEEYR